MASERDAFQKLRMNSPSDLFRAVGRSDIPAYFGMRLAEIKDGSIICAAENGETKEFEADTVLFAIGMRPRYDVVDSLRHCTAETEVFIVGDARERTGGTISTAINQAFQAAAHI